MAVIHLIGRGERAAPDLCPRCWDPHRFISQRLCRGCSDMMAALYVCLYQGVGWVLPHQTPKWCRNELARWAPEHKAFILWCDENVPALKKQKRGTVTTG